LGRSLRYLLQVPDQAGWTSLPDLLFLPKLVELVYWISCFWQRWLDWFTWFIWSPVPVQGGWTGLPDLLFLTKLVEPVYLISYFWPSWLNWYTWSPVPDQVGWTGLSPTVIILPFSTQETPKSLLHPRATDLKAIPL